MTSAIPNFDEYYADLVYEEIGWDREKDFKIKERGGDDPNSSSLSEHRDQLPAKLQGFYDSCDGILLRWNPVGVETAPEVGIGNINLLPLSSVFNPLNCIDLSGREWEVNDQPNRLSLTGTFRPVDWYRDESCIGYLDCAEKDKNVMYFHDYGISFYSLKIDFEGYFKLMCKTRGYIDWPKFILYLEYGQKNGYGKSVYEELRDELPKLFPDFNFDEFIALYQSLKIED